ncbi:MAG: valine--tRNA ligase [Opitutales bacterium]|nr:valine--tRNA ligase [Opitutales bacterium]
MSELAKTYDPSSIEPKWYASWTQNKAFHAEAPAEGSGKETYSIVIPPPNVTGMLHMGHVLDNTLQDIFIRRARLEGKVTVWQPGTDHAGIATQTKVERILREETGQTRHDLGRDEFLKHVWAFRDKNGGIILNQLQKLGASCDWDRTSFTLDPHYAKAVLRSFVELYKRGYIYRGRRMVNWCPKSLTALSDEEVIMKPQNGFFYKMRYELVEAATGADGVHRTHLEISTTRPETLMGDSAVAVHPEDERYKHLVGKMVWRPFPRAQIPIIADEAVDKEFGTGCLKVTPAHDRTDYEIGQRHNLEVIDVLNPDGTLNALAGPDFEGMDRFAARKKAADKLEAMGLLIEREKYSNNVGFSERADVPIEPRLSRQWFLRYPKVAEAKRAVEIGAIQFQPQRWEKTYLHWLDKIQDWCISRQLWWGHRIPVWYRKGIPETELDFNNPEHVHVSENGPADPENWEQDPDVLDTWASSNLWPFANFGWPDFQKGMAEFKAFYPTNVLVTGFDIIFFWVARMIMSALELVGDAKDTLTDDEIRERVPFRNVFIHGLIRDDQGRKMSKSLGNSPDPLDLIAKYGADGLRFGIVNIAPSGADIYFSEPRIEVGRNFCNKLWNACRFRQMSGPVGDNRSVEAIAARIDGTKLDLFDHWILSRMVETTATVERIFENYELHQMTQALYAFFWGDFCDWYVEASKAKLQGNAAVTSLAVQDLVIRQTLLLLHPLMPHLTEELWQQLGYAAKEGDFIQNSVIPTAQGLKDALAKAGAALNEQAAANAQSVNEMVVKLRGMKADYNLASRRDVKFQYVAEDAKAALINQCADTILRLAGAASLDRVPVQPEGAPAGVTPLCTAYIDLAGSVDIEAEKVRLSKELEKLDKAIAGAKARLSNEKFVASAPAAVVQGAKDQLAQNEEKKAEIERLLASFGA